MDETGFSHGRTPVIQGLVIRRIPPPGRRTGGARRGPVLAQRGQMGRRRVALVAVEAVQRVAPVQGHHFRVAGHLGEDRCGGDRRHPAVALDHRFGGTGEHRAPITVHQHRVHVNSQGFHRPHHGQMGGVVNVQTVDLVGLGAAQGPAQGALADGRGEPLPARRGELLGIRQAVDGPGRVQHHGGGDHGAHQGPRPTSSTPASRMPARQAKALG